MSFEGFPFIWLELLVNEFEEIDWRAYLEDNHVLNFMTSLGN